MMNLEEIAQRIKNPFLCGSVDIDQLNQLSNKYPYSQAFSILYLKALSVNNDVRFDDELNQHAYKITDRMRLFELINEKEKVSVVEVEIEDKVEVESEIEVETEVEVELESKIEVEKEVKVVSELDILVDAVIKSEVENEMIAKEIGEDNSIEPPLFGNENVFISTSLDEDKIEIELEKTKIEALDIPEVEIIPTKSFEIINEDLAINETLVIPLVNIDSAEEKVALIGENETAFVEEKTPDLPIIVLDKEEINESILEFEMLTHAASSNFLLENVQATEQHEKEVQNEEKKEDEISTLQFNGYSLEDKSFKEPKKVFSSWLKSNKNENYDDEDVSKKKIDHLVNQFIKEEPSISRPKKEENVVEKPKVDFFSPVKKAKQSLDENTLPVSETLAKIFAAQGNFPKAIYAYQQLIVINPEKKIFFANQIEELTKKLNT